MTSTRKSDAVSAALLRCGKEPVHTPGTIQPHGALIAIDSQGLEICYASSNSIDFLGVPPEKLLSRNLDQVFSKKTRHGLANGMMLRDAGVAAGDMGLVQFGTRGLNVTISTAGACTLFEFEKPVAGQGAGQKTLKNLEYIVGQLSAAKTREVLFERTSDVLQTMSGFDRVMVYEFDRDGHGEVVAEKAATGLVAFKGLRFPAWDIPPQARALMQSIPLRCICDVSARPAEVLAATPDLPELDMTQAVLRATSPVHLEYLRNMGSGGTMTLHILRDGLLWGMISMHHRTARFPNQLTRQMCRAVADYFTQKLAYIEQKDQTERLLRSDALRRRLAGGQDTSIADRALLEALCCVLEADGVALLRARSTASFGLVPDEKVLELFRQEAAQVRIFASENLRTDFPRIGSSIGDEIAGVLVASLGEIGRFLFFRRACERIVHWAGAPEKILSDDASGARLNPRASFEAYRQTVRGTSNPWTPEQVRLADELLWTLSAGKNGEVVSAKSKARSALAAQLKSMAAGILKLRESAAGSAVPAKPATSCEKRRDNTGPKTAPESTASEVLRRPAGKTKCKSMTGQDWQAAPAERSVRGQKTRCLILDSDAEASRELARMLSRIGYRSIATVTGGAEALAEIEAQAIDVALLDADHAAIDTLARVERVLRARRVPYLLLAAKASVPRQGDLSVPLIRKPVAEAELRAQLARIEP